MLKGFKEFILRGNVVELAVAVVIGAAFGAIVTAFTDGLLKPLVNAVTPAASPGLGLTIIPGKESTYIDFASVVTAAINFVIVAAVVYFVIVMPLARLQERRRRGVEPAAPEPTDIELLTEIRDLLRTRQGGQD
jgi:large conductance mechanosensitive channel